MTSVVLLEQLKAFTEKIMADMILPVAMQQGDTEQAYRAPEVYLMRLPDSRSAKKKAPYIIHRVIPLATEQQPGSEERTVVSVRSIFCCYNPDEQEGDLALLNMMERFRVELLNFSPPVRGFHIDNPAQKADNRFILNAERGKVYAVF